MIFIHPSQGFLVTSAHAPISGVVLTRCADADRPQIWINLEGLAALVEAGKVVQQLALGMQTSVAVANHEMVNNHRRLY